MKNSIPQTKIAEALGVSPAFISQILNGKVGVSWKMAEKLADMFPGRSIKEWKYAKPIEVKKAFLTKMYSEDMEQH
jgi:plasmid maintenance system antidote protein VapI